MNKETKTILLIDDDDILLSGLSVMIKRAGYNLLMTNKSSEGLRLANELRPDLIICDVIMPYPNGFELRQLLEKDSATSSIPFIFLTSRSSQKEKVYGLDVGADDYITKPFDCQELMARINAALRRSMRERQKAQAQANQKMEEMRREVVRNLSHELRTPINVILGELQMAIRKRFHYDPSQQPYFLHTVVRNSNHLQTLVNDLLILSQIDQGQLDTLRQELDIDDYFYPLIQETQTRWQHRHIKLKFTLDTTVTIHASPNGFKQAVRHLLDNACKFSSSHSTVEILLAENGKGGCILTVADEGPSIPPQYREKVFERFFQISQGYSRSYDGLGLGLTIARAFARSLGGDVRILDSERGCRVQMSIPPI